MVQNKKEIHQGNEFSSKIKRYIIIIKLEQYFHQY